MPHDNYHAEFTFAGRTWRHPHKTLLGACKDAAHLVEMWSTIDVVWILGGRREGYPALTTITRKDLDTLDFGGIKHGWDNIRQGRSLGVSPGLPTWSEFGGRGVPGDRVPQGNSETGRDQPDQAEAGDHRAPVGREGRGVRPWPSHRRSWHYSQTVGRGTRNRPAGLGERPSVLGPFSCGSLGEYLDRFAPEVAKAMQSDDFRVFVLASVITTGLNVYQDYTKLD